MGGWEGMTEKMSRRENVLEECGLDLLSSVSRQRYVSSGLTGSRLCFGRKMLDSQWWKHRKKC